LSQRVAVKLVRPEALTMQDAQERFRREARAAARLRSEHVVRVMDVGTLDGGSPFMVMEFLDGHDLAQELAQRGPLPVEEAVGYMLQACEALAEAHACGIVHRDLKPANLFLSAHPDGSRVVKVLDFGVSKAASNNGAANNLALTQDFAMIGSPLYMSPEQMRSAKDVDARSDIWALGVIAFELLAGRPPYLEDSIADLVRSMLEPPPSLRGLRPEVPEALEQTTLRCLQRNPALRYADVGLFAQALSRFAPEMRALAERARRVLGNSEPRPSSTERAALISTLAAETPPLALSAPPSAVSAPPTVTAWGEHQLRERRPIIRRAGIASLLLLMLGGVGFGLNQLLGSGATPSASASGLTSASTVSAARIQGPVEAVPVPSAPLPPALEPPSSALEVVAVAPSSSTRPASKPRPLAKPPRTSALVGTPAKATASELPDFGGRR
jgi:serine/threonine-protein kinase